MDKPIEKKSVIKRNKEKLKGSLSTPMNPTTVMWSALGVITLALLAYWLNFSYFPYQECEVAPGNSCDFNELSQSTGIWGQFGDFLGGTVNPIIGFLTICLLVGELRETRTAATEARSAQERTERALRDQLTEAKSQNNFANYYKHLEEFIKYISEIHQNQAVININPRKLHSVLYPSRNFTEELSKYSIRNRKYLATLINDLSDAMRSLIESGMEDRHEFMEQFRIVLITYDSRFDRTLFHTIVNLHKIFIQATPYYLVNGSIKQTLENLVEYLIVVNSVLDFEPDFNNYLRLTELLKSLQVAATAFPNIAVDEELTITSDPTNFIHQLANLQLIAKTIEDFDRDYADMMEN